LTLVLSNPVMNFSQTKLGYGLEIADPWSSLSLICAMSVHTISIQQGTKRDNS